MPSDHSAVLCGLNIARPKPAKITISFRKFRDIDMNEFRSDITHFPLYISPAHDLDNLVRQYDSVLSDLMNKHALLITRTIRSRPNAPWSRGGGGGGTCISRWISSA